VQASWPISRLRWLCLWRPARSLHGADEAISAGLKETLPTVSATSMLREAGYAVIEAVDGLQASTLFLREPSSFDAMVADVVMPRMPGTALAARVRDRRPELPVLLMSAYTGTDLTARRLLETPASW
jgi:DNA-binding NarL/FixJ family response regulator